MAKAIVKYVRMSPRKLRRVVDVIRGKSTIEAQTILKFMPYAAAKIVEKVLKSAVSNAKENEKLDPKELKISYACVDGAPTLRRWRAVSRGRGYPILKRTSHVTLEVVSDSDLASSKPVKAATKYEHKDKEKKEEKK
ncbi:MAG: 50S ribosomal protein L22 [Candidatus Melainabacteria bacterium]|nr:50S ribosomal protein L22 [Candidatus Melainabacteria bacterium]